MTALRCVSWLAVSPDPFLKSARNERLVDALVAGLQDGERGLNLGSGRTSYGSRVVNLDLGARGGVQVCGNGERLPFRDGTFSLVLVRGVLEHVRHSGVVRDEVRRVLRTGGRVYVEVPFLQPFHLSPEDHRRFSLPGLCHFLSDFERIDAGVHMGPGSTLSWITRELLASLLSFGSPSAYRKILALSGWLTFWIRYLDAVIVAAPHVAHAASAVYFLGEKRR